MQDPWRKTNIISRISSEKTCYYEKKNRSVILIWSFNTLSNVMTVRKHSYKWRFIYFSYLGVEEKLYFHPKILFAPNTHQLNWLALTTYYSFWTDILCSPTCEFNMGTSCRARAGCFRHLQLLQFFETSQTGSEIENRVHSKCLPRCLHLIATRQLTLPWVTRCK